MSGSEGFTQLAPIDLNSGSQGAGGILIEAPQYKHQYVKGRFQKTKESFAERLCYECGVSYIIGNILGAGYGTIDGFRNQNYPNWKLKLNSVLNGSGKFASRTGNFLGVFAIVYRISRWGLHKFRGRNDKWNDIGSITLAGGLTALPKGGVMVPAGGGLILGSFAASYIYFKSYMEDHLDVDY